MQWRAKTFHCFLQVLRISTIMLRLLLILDLFNGFLSWINQVTVGRTALRTSCILLAQNLIVLCSVYYLSWSKPIFERATQCRALLRRYHFCRLESIRISWHSTQHLVVTCRGSACARLWSRARHHRLVLSCAWTNTTFHGLLMHTISTHLGFELCKGTVSTHLVIRIFKNLSH